MKKTDITLGSIMAVISVFVFFMIFKLPNEARIYPLFVTTLLALFTIIHLVTTFKKENDEAKNPFAGIQVKQLLFVLGLSGLYVGLINVLGYVTSTVLYLFAVLLGFNTSKKLGAGVTIGFTAAIYILFKIVLKVPLPTGFLI